MATPIPAPPPELLQMLAQFQPSAWLTLAWLWLACGIFVGATFGSFWALIRSRSKQQHPGGWKELLRQITWEPSHCDHCKKHLAWYWNVPVISWLILRGKCWYCKGKIPAEFWLFEVTGAVTCGWPWLVWYGQPALMTEIALLSAGTVIVLIWSRPQNTTSI